MNELCAIPYSLVKCGVVTIRMYGYSHALDFTFLYLALSLGFSSVATKFVTSQVFWEGDFSLAGSPADIDPEGIKWLQV